jgi:hypothetical protein
MSEKAKGWALTAIFAAVMFLCSVAVIAQQQNFINLTTGVTGVLAVINGGTGSATATGSGLGVLQTSPTLITPVLGVATGTSLAATGTVSGKRMLNTGASSLVNGDFVLSGWGTVPSYTVAGNDQGFEINITVTAGSSIGPTFTLTFHDGAFTQAPYYVGSLIGGSGVGNVAILQSSFNTNNLTMTYQGTPSGGLTYLFNVVTSGNR